MVVLEAVDLEDLVEDLAVDLEAVVMEEVVMEVVVMEAVVMEEAVMEEAVLEAATKASAVPFRLEGMSTVVRLTEAVTHPDYPWEKAVDTPHQSV